MSGGMGTQKLEKTCLQNISHSVDQFLVFEVMGDCEKQHSEGVPSRFVYLGY